MLKGRFISFVYMPFPSVSSLKVANAVFEKATHRNVTAIITSQGRDRKNLGENQPEPPWEIPPMQIVLDGWAWKS